MRVPAQLWLLRRRGLEDARATPVVLTDRTFRWWPSFPIRFRAEGFGYDGFSGRSVLRDVNGPGPPLCRRAEFRIPFRDSNLGGKDVSQIPKMPLTKQCGQNRMLANLSY